MREVYIERTIEIIHQLDTERLKKVYTVAKYSLQGTTQGNGLTGSILPVRFSM